MGRPNGLSFGPADQAKKVKKHKKAFEAEVDELDERQKHDIGRRQNIDGNGGTVEWRCDGV